MKLIVMKQIKYSLLLFALLSTIKPPGGVQFLGISLAFASEDDQYNEDPINPENPENPNNGGGEEPVGTKPQDPADDPVVVKQPYPGPSEEAPVAEQPAPAPVEEAPPVVVEQPAPVEEAPPVVVEQPAPLPEPVKYRCDILLDKTGLYLNMFNSGYMAISNVTECMLNEANGIGGSCDDKKLITVLKNDQVRSINELNVPRGSLVTIIEDKDPSFFLCFSWTHGLILSVANSKVVMINPAPKKSKGLFGF